jgi:hypothetical protein
MSPESRGSDGTSAVFDFPSSGLHFGPMRSWLLLFAVVVALAAGVVGARPIAAESDKPVVFLSPELASVDPNFRPHPDRNRVYYAGSLKHARGWAKYTSIPHNLCPYNCDYDFRKYGVL